YHTALIDVLNNHWVDEALPLVLEATRHENGEVVRSAAEVLGKHAGQEAVEPLVAAVERLAAQPVPTDPSERELHLYGPIDVTEKLINHPQWKLTAAQLERLQKAAVHKGLRERLGKKLAEVGR